MGFWGLLLLPFSFLYGLLTWVRNKLFDIGFLSSKKHAVPVISIGNLSMGGTGKTPFTEFLIRTFQENLKIATLSRGYGRKTRGFVLADERAKASTIGDEPMQYFKKFKSISVAVSENRNLGVKKLTEKLPNLDLVLLDDAFQHRFITPGLNILLTDFYNLYTDDYVFPSGKLREYKSGANRAGIVIVTKTPVVLSPITRRRISRELKLKKNQLLLFSKIQYGELQPFSKSGAKVLKKRYTNIILFSGIANNYPLQDHLSQFCSELIVMSFPDHHTYIQKDIDSILDNYNELFTKSKIIVTTEKDAMRIYDCKRAFLFDGIPIYYLPIETVFHNEDGDILTKTVANFLASSNRRNKEIKVK